MLIESLGSAFLSRFPQSFNLGKQGDFMKTHARKGQPTARISKDDFVKNFQHNFFDPHFDSMKSQIMALSEIAWENYQAQRKSPRKIRAGREFKNPNYELSQEWLTARNRLIKAEQDHREGPSRILVINGSPRNQYTCAGEISKSFRLAEDAVRTIEAERDIAVEYLDLSLLTAQYGKVIHPCKGCASTAMPLCHWPCSCYPNHSLNQVQDWMSEIFEMWVRAHGIMIVTPVHWYQAPSVLKLMIDRLVCADGGNPDPTTTHGKNVEEAKKLELKGWHYPKHLKGRAFSVFVHGDSAGTETLRRSLVDWLTDMGLIQAGPMAAVDDLIGYYRAYATSHYDLDKDKDIFVDLENAAKSLVHQVRIIREDKFYPPEQGLVDPEPK